MIAWTITIPGWHPPAANDWVGHHWSRKHKLRKEATDFLSTYARLAEAPKAAGARRVRLELAGWEHGGPFPDEDAYDKLLLDALVNAGLLVDDDAKGLVGRVEVRFERGPKTTTLILEDVAP